MRLLSIIKKRVSKRRAHREELIKQERLIAEHARRLDSHGFPMRTHWPD